MFTVLIVATLGAINVSTPDQLNAAILKAQPGDTIVLANGTYAGEVFIPARISGEIGKPITIKAAETWKAAIYAGGGYGDGIRLAVGCKDFVFEGLHIYGARYCGIRFQKCTRIKIIDCRVELCRAQGLLGSGEQHWIQGNLIQRNGLTKWDHGLYLAGRSHSVLGNVIRGNFGWGIHLYSGDGEVSFQNGFVTGNVVYDNKFVGILIWDGGNNFVIGNHSWGNGRQNYQWQFPDPTNRIFGNLESDPGRWILKAVPEPTGGYTVPVVSAPTSQPN